MQWKMNQRRERGRRKKERICRRHKKGGGKTGNELRLTHRCNRGKSFQGTGAQIRPCHRLTAAPNHVFLSTEMGLYVNLSLIRVEGGSRLDKSQAIKARKLKHTAKLLFADDSCRALTTARVPEKTNAIEWRRASRDLPGFWRDI